MLLQETPISISTAAGGSWLAPDGHKLIRVVIADGRPIVRDGLRRLLQTESRLRIVPDGRDDDRIERLVQR